MVCGIRGEILRAEDIANPPRIELDDETQDESRELRLLVPNIEMATGASPAFLPGNPPSTLAQSLSQRLYSLLHSTRLVDVKPLRILYQPPKSVDEEMDEPDVEPEVVAKAYWTLYIDILFISLDGNPFDAAWAAMIAALKNTKLPKAWWDAGIDNVVCSDQAADTSSLTLRGSPMPITFAVFDTRRRRGTSEEESDWLLADPDSFEEDMCDEVVTVTVDGKQLQKIEKYGGTVIDKEHLRRITALAEARWKEWNGILRATGG